MGRTALPTLDEVLEKAFNTRWEARGKEEMARNMLKSGFPVEQVAALSVQRSRTIFIKSKKAMQTSIVIPVKKAIIRKIRLGIY